MIDTTLLENAIDSAKLDLVLVRAADGHFYLQAAYKIPSLLTACAEVYSGAEFEPSIPRDVVVSFGWGSFVGALAARLMAEKELPIGASGRSKRSAVAEFSDRVCATFTSGPMECYVNRKAMCAKAMLDLMPSPSRMGPFFSYVTRRNSAEVESPESGEYAYVIAYTTDLLLRVDLHFVNTGENGDDLVVVPRQPDFASGAAISAAVEKVGSPLDRLFPINWNALLRAVASAGVSPYDVEAVLSHVSSAFEHEDRDVWSRRVGSFRSNPEAWSRLVLDNLDKVERPSYVITVPGIPHDKKLLMAPERPRKKAV